MSGQGWAIAKEAKRGAWLQNGVRMAACSVQLKLGKPLLLRCSGQRAGQSMQEGSTFRCCKRSEGGFMFTWSAPALSGGTNCAACGEEWSSTHGGVNKPCTGIDPAK